MGERAEGCEGSIQAGQKCEAQGTAGAEDLRQQCAWRSKERGKEVLCGWSRESQEGGEKCGPRKPDDVGLVGPRKGFGFSSE